MSRPLSRYLSNNNGTWRYERRVPKELVGIVGKQWIREQFKGVKDRRDAERAAVRRTAEWDREFATARALVRNASDLKAAIADLQNFDPKNPQRALMAIAEAVQARNGVQIPGPTVAEQLAAKPVITPADLQELKADYQRARKAVEQGLILADAQNIAKRGKRLQEDPEAARALGRIDAGLRADQRKIEALIGEAQTLRLDADWEGLIDRWSKEATPADKTVDEFRTIVGRFKDVVGDVRVRDVTVDHVRAFKDALVDTVSEKTGKVLSKATVLKHLGAIKALLSVAESAGLITDNPAIRVKLAKGALAKLDEERRDPLTNDQLKKVYGFLVEYAKATEDRTRKQGWLGLCLLFTGARRNEVVQLTKADVESRDSVDCFVIHGKRRGKKVKNKKSERAVPIHKQLLALGFLKFVEDQSDGLLFSWGAKDTGDAFGKAISKKLVDLGIKLDGAVVIHSLRHTMKDALRATGADKELRDRVMGHASDDEAADYGHGFLLHQTQQAIDKVYAFL